MPAAAGAGEYHGFCTSDISKIDPGFGSPELLRDLVQDAHALNMRVLLDVQVNHVCAKGMKYKANPNVEKVSKCIKETEIAYWGLDRGYPLIPSENRQSLTYSDLPKYLQHESFFIRCGPKAMYSLWVKTLSSWGWRMSLQSMRFRISRVLF